MRGFLTGAAVLILVAPRGLGQTRLSVPYTADTLANGFTLIVHEDHSSPIATTDVWYHVGSADEKSGRTGFAHLFEHLMFTGSEHAPYPAFDRLLEAAGVDNNGSTSKNRTNYYEWGPTNAVPLMLWLEADRMGFFLPTLDSQKVEVQREVVKNERRQRIENEPYGLSSETMDRMLYPQGHPYSWPVIGSMEDLSRASLEDVREFFRRYYAPSNAAMVVAGDVRTADIRALAEKYFSIIPRGPAITRPKVQPFTLDHDTAAVLEDRVQLPRIYYRWHTVAWFAPDDAALDLDAYILAGAKNSRLTKKLVYDLQLATEVVAFQNSNRLDGDFVLWATARPGHDLAEIRSIIDAELKRLALEGPTPQEVTQAQNSREASFLSHMEEVQQKADRLNAYYYATGQPDYFAKDLARYRATTAAGVQEAARTYLTSPKVVLSVVPQGTAVPAAQPMETKP
jgi:zinc protease